MGDEEIEERADFCVPVPGEGRTHPNEYLACTSCLMPVSMPPMPMKAGGMHVSRAKKRMTREESRRFMPKLRVASKPVGILGWSFSTCYMVMWWWMGVGAHGSRFSRQVKKMVKRLLYWVTVRCSTGTGLMPLSSTPACRSRWYHRGCFS